MTSNSDSTMHLSPPLPATSAVIRTRSRRTLRALGDEVQLHLTGADTDGQYSMFTVITAPGGGPPPHVHDNEDEWFHVIEGKVGFFSGGAWTEVGPGGSAYLPRGVAHTFRIWETPLPGCWCTPHPLDLRTSLLSWQTSALVPKLRTWSKSWPSQHGTAFTMCSRDHCGRQAADASRPCQLPRHNLGNAPCRLHG